MRSGSCIPEEDGKSATGVGGQSENRLSRDEARRNHREHRHVVGVAVKAALKLRRLASRQNAPSALNFETKAPAFAPGRRLSGSASFILTLGLAIARSLGSGGGNNNVPNSLSQHPLNRSTSWAAEFCFGYWGCVSATRHARLASENARSKSPASCAEVFLRQSMTINGSGDPVKTGNQILRAFAALHSEIPTLFQ